MEVIIMTNGQMGISCFERSGNYNCSYRWKHCSSCRFLKALPPHLGVPLKRKFGKKLRVYGLQIKALSEEDSDNGLVGGGILEKEFEFRPSFNEYLKAMESVRTGIEKKQVRKSSGYNSKDYSRSGNISSLNRDENGAQVRRFKDHRHGERISKIMENGNGATDKEDVINHKLQYKEMRVSILNDNLDGKESNADAKVKKKLGEVTRNRRKLKNDTNSMIAEDFHVEENKMTRDTRKGPVTLDIVANSGGSIREKENFTHGSTEMFGRDLMSLEDEEVGRRRNKTSERLVSNRSFNKNCDDNRLVMERAAFKNLEEFNGVMDKPRVSRMEMEERIQRLAKFLNGADIGMPEWMFSKTMRSAKIKYTDHSILRVIQLLGKLGNWRRVLQVIEWLQMRERFKSHKLRNIYTTALNVLGKARRPVEALNVFHAMQKQMSTYPDLVAYHCIAVTLGQAGYMKELFDVIDFMRSPPKKKFKIGTLEKWDPRLEPDIVVYNAVLNACVRRKQWEGAFWVLQQLKEQGQQPSTSTYGLIMEVMFACRKYNLVHEFFRKMQKSSIPNALAYNVVVNTLWREGKTDEAVMAIQEMEKRGIVGSAALYYDLARCLCSAGRCQEALLQIEKICKVASKPLVVTYTGLIQACLDSGNIQNATYIFNEMKSFCSPNLVTCNIMLKAYLEHRLFEDAKELFYNMLEDGSHIKNKTDYKIRVIPDIYSFNTMLDACSADKRWDDFEYIYRRMLRHGYHFNTKRHLRMILDASRAGKEELLEITWEHLVEADRTPPASLVKERFCIMLEKENYESALDCIVSTCPTSDLQPFSKPAWLNLFKENRQRFKKDTLVHLMHELSIVVARSNPETRVQRNLLTSCHDFLRNQTEVPEMNLAEVVSAVQSETALKLSMK